MNHKKAFEIAMLGGALVMSLTANAATGTGCNAGTGSAITGASTSFVKTNFTPKCSAGVSVQYNDGGSDFAVQGASAKGKTIYGAGTAGGTVTACSTVTGSPTASAPGSATGNGC